MDTERRHEGGPAKRSLDDLIVRIGHANRNLGPHNTYRLLLVECVSALQQIDRKYRELRAAEESLRIRAAADQLFAGTVPELEIARDVSDPPL